MPLASGSGNIPALSKKPFRIGLYEDPHSDGRPTPMGGKRGGAFAVSTQT